VLDEIALESALRFDSSSRLMDRIGTHLLEAIGVTRHR
jgi:hypothetical protein